MQTEIGRSVVKKDDEDSVVTFGDERLPSGYHCSLSPLAQWGFRALYVD